MPLILNIETATEVCSVCLSQNGAPLALRESTNAQDHAAQITLMIADCFREIGLELATLDAVAVSDGPGSYTSLRIGLATAKGICYALDKPLIAVPTLQSMAWAAAVEMPDANIFVPMIDARRMEVYMQAFDRDTQPINEAEAVILHPALFDPWLQAGQSVVCAGNGSDKAEAILAGTGVYFSGVRCSAPYLVALAEAAFAKAAFADIAYHAPFYLKPPNITIPRKGL